MFAFYLFLICSLTQTLYNLFAFKIFFILEKTKLELLYETGGSHIV